MSCMYVMYWCVKLCISFHVIKVNRAKSDKVNKLERQLFVVNFYGAKNEDDYLQP